MKILFSSALHKLRLAIPACLVLATALLLFGCASAGKRIDRTHLNDIKNGVQTKSQIQAWFSEPYTMGPAPAGHPNKCTERWSYEYAKARGFGTVTYSEVLIVDFDDKGRVCDHGFSKSGSE